VLLAYVGFRLVLGIGRNGALIPMWLVLPGALISLSMAGWLAFDLLTRTGPPDRVKGILGLGLVGIAGIAHWRQRSKGDLRGKNAV
jgi:MYXO-CTERM domain-containing protein